MAALVLFCAAAHALQGTSRWSAVRRSFRVAARESGEAQAEPARTSERRRSHRWRGGEKIPAGEKAKPRRRPPAAPKIFLAPGRWRPEVAEALEKLLGRTDSSSAGYDRANPPVAALVFDDALITQHVGEALFQRLVSEAEFKFGESFWELIPVQFGKMRIRAGYDGFRETARASWPRNSYYQMYRKGFFRCHRELCRQFGRKHCARWRAQLLAGFTETELRTYAKEMIARELERPLAVERVGDTPEDPDPETVRAGLRTIPEMLDLAAKLKARGAAVWILSSADRWSAEEFALDYGVEPARVIGVGLAIEGDRLTVRELKPIPEGAGSAEAVALFIGRSPALIIGGEADDELLSYGRGLRIKIGAPGASPADLESRRRWLIQPRFSPVREPQSRPTPVESIQEVERQDLPPKTIAE